MDHRFITTAFELPGYKVVGTTAYLSGDTNGDAKADFSIALSHVTTLSASDIIL